MAMLGGTTLKEGVWRDLALGARFARVIVPQVPLLGHLLCQVRAVHRHLAQQENLQQSLLHTGCNVAPTSLPCVHTLAVAECASPALAA